MPADLRIAVLASGLGTTLDDLAAFAPSVGAQVVRAVADRPGILALDVARRHRIPTSVVPVAGHDPAAVADALDRLLREDGVELVVLAGLRSILPAEWVARWGGRVINVHPSLLPRYGGGGQYGSRVYEAILASGDPESGASVHLVTAEVDAGPVLAQDAFAVTSGETVASLQAKTQAVERRLLRTVVANFASRRWALPYEPPEAPADAPVRTGARGEPAGRTPSAASGVGRSGTTGRSVCRVVFGGYGRPDRARATTSDLESTGPGCHRPSSTASES
jgi:phosphoribosylglycinamide formyltransferase-1